MYKKINKLSILQGNTVEIDMIEIKRVIRLDGKWLEKTRGEKMKVSAIMLLKTHVSKMSETGLAIISMKTMHIEDACHYIDENKESYPN